MEMNDYQHQAQRTSPDDHDKVLNGVLGLCGEAGEVSDIIKKNRFQGHGIDRTALLLELGDALWYIAEATTGLGATLEEVAQMNIAKLKKRYPDGFDARRSVEREG